jgi:hypothetical protein
MVSMTLGQKSTKVFTVLLVLLPAAFLACGGDDENCAPYDSDELPPATAVIRVNESNFTMVPSTVQVGDRVEWQNWFRQPRTVISGTGPDDPERGQLFSETLLPYCSGEAIGGRFQMVFTEPDTIHFYNDILPPGYVGNFHGMFIVLP